jgi:hypothetical protein
MENELARIWCDQSLVEEFKEWRTHLEEKTGNKLNGGSPTISKICAEILKRIRTKNKKVLRLEITKIKGLDKCEVNFLFD